jgi:hypothetical protein
MASPCQVLMESGRPPGRCARPGGRRLRGLAHRGQVQPLPPFQHRPPHQRLPGPSPSRWTRRRRACWTTRDACTRSAPGSSTSPRECCGASGASTAATGCPPPRTVEKVRALVGWERVAWDGHALPPRAGDGDRLRRDRQGVRGRSGGRGGGGAHRGELPREPGRRPAGHPSPSRRPPLARGIESPDVPVPLARHLLQLHAGALATSGDSKRFLLKDGVRYGHILDPHHRVARAGRAALRDGRRGDLASTPGCSPPSPCSRGKAPRPSCWPRR